MANRTLNTRLRLKYDTAANWATKNPVLLAGEAGIESDTLLAKIGDGTHAWQQLGYLNADSAKRVSEYFAVIAASKTEGEDPLNIIYTGEQSRGLGFDGDDFVGYWLNDDITGKPEKDGLWISLKQSIKDILNGALRFDVAQSLTDAQKTQARSNIGAGTGTITGIKMNGASKGTSGVVDLGTVLTDASKFATAAQGTKADNAMPKSGGTFTGEVKFGSTENFQGYYIKRMIGSLGAGTRYADLDSSYKDGTYHRMWRLRFPSGSSSNFWGKIKITLYGGYSSFNASGVMSKSITCNFNTSNIYNNVGCYDGLGVNVEQDFRISEAIWNATASAWEVLIWQKNLNGNNSPTIMLECWTTNNTNYINTFNGIAAQSVELTQSTSYSAQKASPTGGTKTVEWETLPVYENPLGEEIATMSDLSNKANLNGGNTFTGKQLFNNTVNGVTNQLALNETQWDIFTCRDLTSPTTKTAVGKGYVWCQDNDSIYSQFKATGIYYGNDTSGYEGTLKFPTNISGEKTIATTSDIPTFNYNSSTKILTIS